MHEVDAERLSRQLAANLALPRSRGAPSLSYGRHRGPAPSSARVAAVAVTLFQDAGGEWIIPLTLRPRSLQHHGGQICLPGGRVEAGEDVFSAAMREFEEELGVPPQVVRRCGELSSLYVYASHNLVHPVVAVIDRPATPWQPDPIEVEQVIPVPLGALLEDTHRAELVRRRSVRRGGQLVGKMTFRATAIQYDGQFIWGATALILEQLAQILRSQRD